MDVLNAPLVKRLAVVFMLCLAGTVLVHFIGTQFYDPDLQGRALTAWRVIDPIMVAGLLMVLLLAFARKRRLDAEKADQSITREYLEANGVFYFSGALLAALLWNWVGVEWSEPITTQPLVWTLIDSALPLLLGSTAFRLLREARG